MRIAKFRKTGINIIYFLRIHHNGDSMDRRQQKTRDAIFDAFSDLLSVKSYSKISIQDIIDAANVGRTTFYAHFQTKDDLLKEMCADLFDHIFSESLHPESTHDFSLKTGNPGAMMVHILYHIKDSGRIVRVMTSESGGMFTGFFKESFGKLVSERMLKGTDVSGIPEDFLVNHISSSFVGMVQWWIGSGMVQTPEEMVGNFMKVLPLKI